MRRRVLVSMLGSMATVWAMLCGNTLDAYSQTIAVANGNWSTGSTWSAGEPTDTLPATINGGFTVTIDQFGEITNLIDVGTAEGESGTLTMTGGDLTVFDSDGVTEPNSTAIRLGQAAGASGTLTMTGGQIFISEDQVDVFDDGDLTVGQFGTGTATISGGILTAADEIFIARDPNSAGTVTVDGTGEMHVSGRNLLVGFGGANAEFNVPGGHGTLNVGGSGKVTVADTLFMGFGDGNAGAGLAGAHGEVNISESANVTISNWMQSGFGRGTTSEINQTGGALYIAGLLVHAARGTATFNHSGGALTANLIIIGDGVDDTPSHGTYNISGNATVDTQLIFWVGAWGRSTGVVNQDGGTLNVGALTVGRDGAGEYTMTDGTLNVKGTDGAPANNHLIVGQVGNADENIAKGSGIVEQTGGMVTVKTGVFLGDYDHSEGIYKISGGTLNVDGTGSHVPVNYTEEDFIGDFSVGGALASNALVARVEPANANDAQGQALDANGTFIVSGSAATISIAGNFLANPADKSSFRSDPGNPGGDNSATLGFEIFDNSGTSLINVGGVADLDGAVIDLDLMGSFTPAVNATFDLLRASSFGATGTGTTQNVGTGEGFSLAPEDVGGWSLAVVPSGGFEYLRATFLGSVGTPGDFDGDGDVDGRDFLVWQRDTSVGSLADWQANYGAGGLAALATVPEPTSVALLSVIGVCAFAVSGRKATR